MNKKQHRKKTFFGNYKYSQEDIDAHGSKENLRKAIIDVRDLNKEALIEIINKIKEQDYDHHHPNTSPDRNRNNNR